MVLTSSQLCFKTLTELRRDDWYDIEMYNFLKFNLYSSWRERYADEIITEIKNTPSLCYILSGRKKLLIEKELYRGLSLDVIGYIILHHRNFHKNKNCNVRYINVVDTFIQKENLCIFMIDKIEKKLKTILLPYCIADNAINYWIKYFKIKHNINSFNEMRDFLKLHKIDDIYLYDKLYRS